MKKLVLLAAFVVFASIASPRAMAAESNIAEQAVALFEKLANIIDADKADCDKMGNDVSRFADENAALLAAIRAHREKLTPEQKKELEKKYGDRMRAAVQKMMPGIMACSKNDKVKVAFDKFRDLAR